MANTKPSKSTKASDEMTAMTVVYEALRPLEPDVQRWILRSLIDRFQLGMLADEGGATRSQIPDTDVAQPLPARESRPEATPATDENITVTSGISPVAQKWMLRSGFTSAQLAAIYSLAFDEIDLVSHTVPGRGKKAKMRSVLLLKCMAAYLGTGAPRVAHEKAKEACIHYSAYNQNSFAWYLKSFAREVGGTKETGYSLTAAGMTAATELIRSMVTGSSATKGK